MRRRLPLLGELDPAPALPRRERPRQPAPRAFGIADTGSGRDALQFAAALTRALCESGAHVKVALTAFDALPALEPALEARFAEAGAELSRHAFDPALAEPALLPLAPADDPALLLLVGVPALVFFQPFVSLLLGADQPLARWQPALRGLRGRCHAELAAPGHGLAAALARALLGALPSPRGLAPQVAARTVAAMTEPRVPYVPGLAGVPAARSSVCFVDGERGKLQYRGYPVEILADRCAYEEVAYLLLFGDLPTEYELTSFKSELSAERRLKFRIIDMLKLFPESGHPMDALAATIAAMGMFYPGDHIHDPEYMRTSAIRLIVKVPTIVAAFHRIRRGDDPIGPRADLGHAANFLYMLNGREPEPLVANALNTMLVLHAEHSMAPSTFCARVASSTLADPYAVVSTAVTALSGSLHGGANEAVLRMLRSIPATGPSAIREWAEDRLARREKISGFGHREYKVKDPRATIEQRLIDELFERFGRSAIYDTAVELETQMQSLVGNRGLYPNIDYYSGIVYEMLGLPTDLFTPMYAVARVAGWLAHLFEQVGKNRMFRPSQVYEGHVDRVYVGRADRR